MENINITTILRDKPKGTTLYSPAFGNVIFDAIISNPPYCIRIEDTVHNYWWFTEFGKLSMPGECMLYPSKEMQDWSKFAWKKGDVLLAGVDNFCIFDNWANDDYTEFYAKFVSDKYGDNYICRTLDWTKEYNEKVIKQYISNIEEIKGGKLNLETLEIDTQTQFKDGDIVYFELTDGYKFISIFQKFSSQKKPLVYAYYFLNDNSLHLADRFDGYDILCDWHEIKEMRLATYSEKNKFLSNLTNIGKKWNLGAKQVKNLLNRYTTDDWKGGE